MEERLCSEQQTHQCLCAPGLVLGRPQHREVTARVTRSPPITVTLPVETPFTQCQVEKNRDVFFKGTQYNLKIKSLNTDSLQG